MLQSALERRKTDQRSVLDSDIKFSHDIKIDDSVKITSVRSAGAPPYPGRRGPARQDIAARTSRIGRRKPRGRNSPQQTFDLCLDRQEVQNPGLSFLDLVQEGNLGSCVRSRNLTTPRASSSPRTRHGGSARRSPARLPTRRI